MCRLPIIRRILETFRREIVIFVCGLFGRSLVGFTLLWVRALNFTAKPQTLIEL